MEIKEKISLDEITHAVRASQAVLQYGVGAMVDFPEQTLMTAAPETWNTSVREIHDERLEKVLRVDYFGMPGSKDEWRFQSGISYTRFPEWYFCPKCRSFKPVSEWVNEYLKSPKMRKKAERDPYMVKRLQCPICLQDLVVARIVVACGHGHIDDFPWVKWVHARNLIGSKKVCEDPKLKFTTSASSTEGLEGLTISCINCNCKTTLKGAFDKNALYNLDKKTSFEYGFHCTGRHPWKNEKSACDEYPHVLQRGSSSVYFPISMSSLVIPPYSSRLTSDVQNSQSFSDLKKAITESIKTLNSLGTPITQEMKDNAIVAKIEEFTKKIALEIGKPEKQIRGILERRWNRSDDPEYTTNSVKYRSEEYVALNGEVGVSDKTGEFIRESTNIKDYDIPFVKSISLIHKVREVQALIGFSRLEPVDSDNLDDNDKITAVNVKEKETNWYPGYEVRGEGIFIEFCEDDIDAWRNENQIIGQRVDLLNENYRKSYYGAKKPREITAKFLLLHTISHLLMKQLSFECGYSIASIKERIYCSEPSDGCSMSGIFIYTASGDSEGTLGGLVRQGRADVFSTIFRKAIETALACSNDPVCSLSQGQGRDSLNLSACYSCALVPETSCEEFNVFLDRGVVIGTFENPLIGFYSQQVNGGKRWEMTNGKEKKVKEQQAVIISDYGIDMSNSDYADVWSNIRQFSDDEKEKKLLKELVEHKAEFANKEKPRWRCTIQVIGIDRSISVDLVWQKSKVMFFASENKDEYKSVIMTGWKSFCGNEDVNWNDILVSLEEK